MPQAKTLSAEQLGMVFAAIERFSAERNKVRDTVMVALSFFAGLRAQEIAFLHVEDVTDVQGRVCDVILVTKRAAKYGKARRLPMSPHLQELLARHIEHYELKTGPLFWNWLHDPMSPGAVQKFFTRLYRKAGFHGATSHSGRRTYITQLARMAGSLECSIRDVQQLAGHSSVDTTQIYMEPSTQQNSLVDLLVERTVRGLQ